MFPILSANIGRMGFFLQMSPIVKNFEVAAAAICFFWQTSPIVKSFEEAAAVICIFFEQMSPIADELRLCSTVNSSLLIQTSSLVVKRDGHAVRVFPSSYSYSCRSVGIGIKQGPGAKAPGPVGFILF